MNINKKYKGIIPYDENEEFEFVGRTEETWALYDRISRNDYTVYYAASGEGKSSLIKAGLLPILRRRDYFPIYIIFEDKELRDLSSIGKVIEKRILIEIDKRKSSYNEISYVQSEWSKRFFSPQESETLSDNLWWKMRNFCFKRSNGTELTPLFIFDQFEEVFTKANYEWTDAFFRWLEEISTDSVPESLMGVIDSFDKAVIPTQKKYKALFSFRTEYLGDLDYWCVQKHFLPALQDNRICLKPLTLRGAREIVNLNKEVLEDYTIEIIRGCTDVGIDTDNEQPCVYALILSVVCKTLSECSEKERITFLDDLNNKRDNAIDKLLLKFYKDKLNEANLDYEKDIQVIAAIEDALINENGKRNRRDMDDRVMLPLADKIKVLCEKGLVKVVGNSNVNGKKVDTVEFPHDRLCKAIDVARKERQKRMEEKIIRQKEWMQFGVVSVAFGSLAYLIARSFRTIYLFVFGKSSIFCEYLKDYFLCNSPQLREGNLEENYSSVFLMLLLAFFSPFLALLYSGESHNKKRNLSALLAAVFSTTSFGLLSLRNANIRFEQTFIPLITVAGFVVSSILLIRSYKMFFSKSSISLTGAEIGKRQSYWPLWGGFLIISVYVFYLCVYDLSVGINEPLDSFWGVFIIPLLYTLFVRGFFHIEMKFNSRSAWTLIIGLIALFLLSMFLGYSHWEMPLHVTLWQNYGLVISLVLILTYFGTFVYSLWYSKPNNFFYKLTNFKRVFLTLGCLIVTISTFYLNLGYNIVEISPRSVVKVYSWRSVIVKSTINDKILCGVLSARGDTIIPCCLDLGYSNSDFGENAQAMANCAEFKILSDSVKENPFKNGRLHNTDSSVIWSCKDKTLTGYILSYPSLEEYLYKNADANLSPNSTLEEAVDYYSKKLFVEMRDASIRWLRVGKSYDVECLPSLTKLEELQKHALAKSMSDFLSKHDSVGKVNRGIEQIMDDQDLVDLECSFVRSLLLCMIKDRHLHQDFPEMISLQKSFVFAFFPNIQQMRVGRNVSGEVNLNLTIDGTVQQFNSCHHATSVTDDVLNRRAFVWYDMFYGLCLQDAGYNVTSFERTYNEKFSHKDLPLIAYFNHFSELVKDGTSNKKLSVEETVEIFNLILRLLSPENSLSFKNQVSQYSNIAQYVKSDLQFDNLKSTILDNFIKCLNARPTGLYNNCLEQTCYGIIIASAFRGYDVESSVGALNKYNDEKKEIYASIGTVVAARKAKYKLLNESKKFQASLDSLVTILQQTKRNQR